MLPAGCCKSSRKQDIEAYHDRFLQVYFTSLKEGFDYWKDEQAMFTPYIRNLLGEREEERGSSELMDGLYPAMRRTTKAFYVAGGGDLITLGTDAPSHGFFLAGFGAHREMHHGDVGYSGSSGA